MNKKKIFTYLFLGLLTVGATGTVTSCKDYDDDINKNTADIQSLQQALTQQKSDLESEISSLKNQLEAKDAELTAAIEKAQKAADNAQSSANGAQSTADAAKKAAADEAVRAAAAEAALDARLKTAESALEDINKVLANKVDKSEFNTKVQDIYAKIETVQSGLADALKKVSANTDAINANKDDIAANKSLIESLQKGLADEVIARKAVAADLEQQKTALATLQNTVKELSTKISGQITDINGKITDLTTKFNTLNDDLTALTNLINDAENGLSSKASVAQLTDVQNTLDAKINKVQAEVNALNVLLKQSLRSLVFVPDLYNWGVEGTKLLTLDAPKYTLDDAKYNVEDASTKADNHFIYPSVNAFQVLDFQANYNMNPSSTDPKSIKSVSLLSDDKPFYTRAAAAGLSVKDFTVNPKDKPGILSVNLNVADKNAIKTVTNDKMLTVFAVQAHINNGAQDTTITSDWATVIKDEAKHLYLFHKTGEGINSYNVPQPDADAHVPACAAKDVAGLGHLIHTGYQAGKVTAPQDSCNWNDSLDLSKYVETHYIDADGVERTFDASKYGLSYKFELVGLFKGDNKTSESAHAAIKGSWFRPQMPNYDSKNEGTQQPYGYAQGRQTIGRTPLVRVSLVDKDGNVYAYGYIRIKITEPGKPAEKARYISYTGGPYTYNQECIVPGWSYNTKWIQTEYDLYNMLGMTREEFEAGYEPDYTSSNVFKQYTLTGKGTAVVIENKETDQNTTYYKDATFKAATEDYGTVTHVADAATSEDGTRSSIIRWNITPDQAKTLMKDKTSLQIAIRYISKVSGKPDVYVVLNTGNVSITKPYATVNWSDAIISNYWYATNANSGKSGTDEIHANVPSPEDATSRGLTVATFSDMFSNVFDGNFVSGKSLFSQMLTYHNLVATNKDYEASKLTINFIFKKANVGRTFKGISGTTYTMAVSADSTELIAKKSAADAGQVVAKITGTDYKDEAATYQETDYAKDLLNYVAHNALDNNFLIATVGIHAVNGCSKVLDIDQNTFNVRFLRPLNVLDNGKEIEDANIVKVQEIPVVDLVKFNDWRDAWDNKTQWGPYTYDKGYTKYYGIKSIKVDGVANGQRISLNANVKTNLGLSKDDAKDTKKWVSLSSVSNQVDFYYIEKDSKDLSKNVLRYTNLSSALSDFDVIVPVTVEYYWGKLHAYATIHVKSTAGGNGAKRR